MIAQTALLVHRRFEVPSVVHVGTRRRAWPLARAMRVSWSKSHPLRYVFKRQVLPMDAQRSAVGKIYGLFARSFCHLPNASATRAFAAGFDQS